MSGAKSTPAPALTRNIARYKNQIDRYVSGALGCFSGDMEMFPPSVITPHCVIYATEINKELNITTRG